MPAILKKRPKKRKPEGITVPEVLTPDTGIHVIKQLTGTAPRLKLWFHQDGKKKYVSLPAGTTMEEARTRRDHLYRNLRQLYQAKKRSPRNLGTVRKPHETSLTPEKFIYRRKPLVIRILGKQIGEADTREQAERLRNKWLKENSTLVPQLTSAIAKL